MADRDRRLAEIAARQHGVFTRMQAVRVGLGSRAIAHRLAAGTWRRVHPGVYRHTAVPPRWRCDLMAALLWAGPDALASHRAAGRLWGLEGLSDGPVEIEARIGRRRAGIIVHRLRAEDRPRRRVLDGIPVTSPDRTIFDLPAVLPLGKAGLALDDALRRGLTTVPRLRRMLAREGRKGRRGTAALRRLLSLRDEEDGRMQSELEARLSRLLRRAGLPQPTPQHEVWTSRGRFVARLDFAYPELKLGIETHGYRWHGGRERWARDIARDNRLKRMGWTVLVFTWDDVVGEPARVRSEIVELHGSRDVLLPIPAGPGGRP